MLELFWVFALVCIFLWRPGLPAIFSFLSGLSRTAQARWPFGACRFTTEGENNQAESKLRQYVPPSVNVSGDLQAWKDLYFKLQNLAKHPSILPQSRSLLSSLLLQASNVKEGDARNSITSIESFEPGNLADFLRLKDERLTLRWEQYIARRTAGKAREMFRDQQHAKQWLRQNAPLKYVDGAWLGHIHRVTTPFALRHITRIAWQVFSEELGDGDISKNHVYVYSDLMKSIGAGLPDADSSDFIDSSHGLNDFQAWRAATVQLLISVFPHEFLPEILGFNMSFEMLTWDTMRAVRELKELGIKDDYFLLHISIDNADSGHTAMAMEAVVEYMQYVKCNEGSSAAQRMWKRIQAGFLLSESLSYLPQDSPIPDRRAARTADIEATLVKIFEAKAPVAHKLHCGTKLKIKGRTLVEWLEPVAFRSPQWQQNFLDALSDSKVWVVKGDSNRSKFVQLLSWGGKMFGSFTQAEVEVVRQWIDSLAHPASESSDDEILLPLHQDVRVHYPVISLDSPPTPREPSKALTLELHTPLPPISRQHHLALLPLWFGHLSLLESMVAIPFKAATPTACAIVRVLRAQYGFAPEGTGVAGMDEVRGTAHNKRDLVDLGLEMRRRAGLSEPGCLKDVLEGPGRQAAFAVRMLHLAMKPEGETETLLGMAWAFVGLHERIAGADVEGEEGLLSPEGKVLLARIAARERKGLQVCLDEMKSNEVRLARFEAGLELARQEIELCFA